jgi:signal transduction histidine kinase/AraC-like DNA-binding protein/CheY-like chemotaxis protein/ABC-type sugar transport system substrate-binding protein
MAEPVRIGLNIGNTEPYWVMLRESILQHAETYPVKMIQLDIPTPPDLSLHQAEKIVEDIVARRINTLITWWLPEELTKVILESNIRIILPAETTVRQPNLVSLSSLYDAAYLVTDYIARKLHGQKSLLAIEGISFTTQESEKRTTALHKALKSFPSIQLFQIPAPYPPEDPVPYFEANMLEMDQEVDAIIGTSDHLTLKAYETAQKIGIVRPGALVAGIGGDPLALDAIANGRMTATVDITPPRFCQHVLNVAYQAALGAPLPKELQSEHELITIENVQENIREKFLTFSKMPSRMVGVNREQQERHVKQLETSLQTIRQMSSIIDRKRIFSQLDKIIHEQNVFDRAYIYFYSKTDQSLVLENPSSDSHEVRQANLSQGGLLGKVYVDGERILVLGTKDNPHNLYDPAYPRTCSRVILPIRLAETVTGVLDLHSYHLIELDQEDFFTLQLLADQIGIAMRNAKLYENAVAAQSSAEEANALKTRFLANISQELRDPLNQILSNSRQALESPQVNRIDNFPQSDICQNFTNITSYASHLLRLINDLLDLSHAEIGELKLSPEMVSPREFVEEIFTTMRQNSSSNSPVEWHLEIPAQLPLIRVDKERFRQILANLLSNSDKFTVRGRITLGAEVLLPNFHVWVEDTGPGIGNDQQDQIFEPFSTSQMPTKRPEEGIGLGLTIARRFVTLHNGSIKVDSALGKGSTFHVSIPLPNLNNQPVTSSPVTQPILLVISEKEEILKEILEIASRHNLEIRKICPGDNFEIIANQMTPSAIAWDISHACPAEWGLVENINQHPIFNKLPFLLFYSEKGKKAAANSVLSGSLGNQPSARSLQETITATRPESTNGSVLIIENDTNTCGQYRKSIALALPQYSVDVVHNSENALLFLKRKTPSLILMDLRMSGMSGFEFLEKLRANPATRPVPVMVISSKVFTDDDIKFLDEQNVALQLKEILTIAELAKSIERFTQQQENYCHRTSPVVKRVLQYLQNNYTLPLNRQQIALEIGVSETYLSNIFHQEVGITLWEYLNRIRLHQASILLSGTRMPINQIAETIGYSDPAYFSRLFHQQFDCSPKEFREQTHLLK